MSQKHTIKDLLKKYEAEDENTQELLKKVLLKKARGFVLEEISEEYCVDENEKMKLTKRKITSKEVAPDISAVKALCELSLFEVDDYNKMSFEELKLEKAKLLKLFDEIESKEDVIG